MDDRTAWYLQDAEQRAYLELRSTKVTTWVDGQEHIGLYRRLAVGLIFALFDPHSTALDAVSKQTSFDRSIPYANYNWELFLHAPLAIAAHLAGQQRFEYPATARGARAAAWP